MNHRIRINKSTGCIEWLAPPPFHVPVEKQSRQRFSEIVPFNRRLRIAFRILRFLFGEKGRVSDWTRRWHTTWVAEILIGQHKGESAFSKNRAELIQWEREIFFEPLTKELQ